MTLIREPYPYQETVGNYLLQGKSVILQAPTGAGKTAAALLPYLHARQSLGAERFPRKCIYSVPMKVLANQFKEEYQKIIKQYGWSDELQVTIHTGDQPDDPRFEGDLIFTTIDQTLSSFINIPYGLGNSLANINAGAILSSYLVLDELHLFDPDTTLPTTLEMLKMLKGITPFIIMTATFSSNMLQTLADLLDAVIVPDPEEPEERKAMERIGSQVGKDRRFMAQPGQLTAEAVLAHDFKRTICICNTVKAAQDLYNDLKAKLQEQGDGETELRLLHSRFYKDDRQEKEEWIRKQFGSPQKDYNGRRLIQIATQVIEVGVDATCDILHTELAPASSLLQRAGRCARREGERGTVYIYLPIDDKGEPYYAPYNKGKRGLQLCEATWTAVHLPEFTNSHMSFSREQALIDAVHTPVDQAIMKELLQISHTRREDMLSVMRNPAEGRGRTPQLIRDVDNRFVFIHPNPNQDEMLLTNPWAYDGFGLYPGMLFREFTQLIEQVDSDTPWLMKGAYGVEDEEAPARQRTQYRWYDLEAKDVYTSAVIAVHPDIAQYDKERGFRFEVASGTGQSPLRSKKKEWERYSYQRETYAEHVGGLFAAYQLGRSQHLPLKDEIAFVVHRLEKELTHFQLAPGQIDQMLRAMFVCHDLGKLDRKWQGWAHAWQKEAGRFYGRDLSLPPDYMAAHTDYNPADERQREAQRRVTPKRPNHAGESGVAAIDLFDDLVGENGNALFYAAMTAIFRHHSAMTSSYEGYELHPAAKAAIQEALQVVDCPPTWTDKIALVDKGGEPVDSILVDFDDRNLIDALLYFLLVRVLRLADQRSQM
jgi:CRISPR-associated endonuclease/helicase Cas3